MTDGAKYRCNCGQEFDARMDRITHMVKCPAMAERAKGRSLSSTEEAAMSGDCQPCPHGSCCEGFGYVISFIEYLLDTSPKDSPEWRTAARIMDEVGK